MQPANLDHVLRPHPSLLRRVLHFDALTGIGALPLALLSGYIAALFGMPINYLGIKFVVFGVYGVSLLLLLRREPIQHWIGWIALVFNTLVTLESAIYLFVGAPSLTTFGTLFLVTQIIAGPVLIALQYVGVRRYY